MSEPFPPGAGGPGAPSEAELRAMLEELREAPVEEVLVQGVNLLLQAAQVKLGRPDARVLIDAVAAVADAVGARARGGIADQVAGAVTQLRMAQVEAEREAGVAPPEEAAPGPATDATTPPPAAAPPPPTAPPSAASRLWIPGR